MHIIPRVLLLISALWMGSVPLPAMARSEVRPMLAIHSADNTTHRFHIEVARTPKEQAIGFMHRESLPKNHGMLFIHDTPREIVMWMKNTLIPLDMIFIDKNNQVSHIHHNAQPHSLDHIHSQGAVKAVLEINGGLAKELNINIGDEVHYVLP